MKIKVSYTWIIVLPIVFSIHLEKVFYFIFIVLSIHESMHILVARQLGYEVHQVKVYPFGLVASIKYLEYGKSIHEICIILAGLLVHILVIPILYILMNLNYISDPFMYYLKHINIQILVFNMIPIYPLDGGRIIKSILEYTFPYRLAKQITLLISVIMVCMYLYFSILEYVSGYLFLCLFLMQYTIIFITYHKQIHDFYLYRFFYGCNASEKVHTKWDLYKNNYNIIIKHKHLYKEQQFIDEYLNKHH